MKLLSQDEARAHLEKLESLSRLENLTSFQACQAVQLLDDLQFSYMRASRESNETWARFAGVRKDELSQAITEIQQKRDEIANDFNVCTVCYIPFPCECDWSLQGEAEQLQADYPHRYDPTYELDTPDIMEMEGG